MITDDEVPFEKMLCDGDSGELLPDARVNSTEKLALGKQTQEPLFKGPDQESLCPRLRSDC